MPHVSIHFTYFTVEGGGLEQMNLLRNGYLLSFYHPSTYTTSQPNNQPYNFLSLIGYWLNAIWEAAAFVVVPSLSVCAVLRVYVCMW